jgi:hypothetical protein
VKNRILLSNISKVYKEATASRFFPVEILKYPPAANDYTDKDPINEKPLPSNYPDIAFLSTVVSTTVFNDIAILVPALSPRVPNIAVLGWGAFTTAREACPQAGLLPQDDKRRRLIDDNWISHHFVRG